RVGPGRRLPWMLSGLARGVSGGLFPVSFNRDERQSSGRKQAGGGRSRISSELAARPGGCWHGPVSLLDGVVHPGQAPDQNVTDAHCRDCITVAVTPSGRSVAFPPAPPVPGNRRTAPGRRL